MLCAKPISLDTGQQVGCGQCLNCRINKRRQWTGRVLLEGEATYAAGGCVSWVTLTYADENLPTISRGLSEPLATVVPSDTQLLVKRMRKQFPLRYFLVGEYGDETFRPHYHALIFGPDTLAVERFLQSDWEQRHGHVRVRPWDHPDREYNGRTSKDVRTSRAAYCAHYVTKKMNQADDPRLKFRHPEFTRMSRRPGIGHVSRLTALHMTRAGTIGISETGDVNRTVRIAGDIWPLAPTTRSWLRQQLGIPETEAERQALLTPSTPNRKKPTTDDYLQAAAYCAKMESQVGKGRTL